ncbi:hypothetical protein VPNG_04053 [Cytospora leucostoma]|uniref:Uncharacterized protein n=1 Tax=Cytospora leucostoma TaxID=1230097 RepID=A0A423XD72_9PEZI|nr:hypothetical protein VPNG_04053 [Cytospora leucostoma]
MAAAEVLAHAPREDYCWPPTRYSTSTTSLEEARTYSYGDALLYLRLGLIADAWMHLHNASQPENFTTRQHRPLLVPEFYSPRWRRGRCKPSPPGDDPVSSPTSLFDPTGTDSAAQQCYQNRENPDVPRPDCTENKKPTRSNGVPGLLANPNAALIDFASDEGFSQAAGKKKRKQTTTFNWQDDNNDNKDGGGQGDGAKGGGDGNRNQNGADSGFGGNTGGDGGDDKRNKKDDEDKGVDDIADDIWGDSVSKQKNKAKTTNGDGPDDEPTTDFHDVKLDDSGGGGSGGDHHDLGLGLGTVKTGLSAWTSSWGAGVFGWGGSGVSPTEHHKSAEQYKPKEATEEHPPNSNLPRPKKTSFGDLDDEEPKSTHGLGSLGGSKPSEKKDAAGFPWGNSDAQTAGDDVWGKRDNKYGSTKTPGKLAEEAPDDVWGWSATRKEQRNMGKSAIMEELPASDLVHENGSPHGGQKAEDIIPPEPALTPEEEAELKRLQTRKDMGKLLPKRLADRYKALTEKVEAAKLAAEVAAAQNKAAEPPAQSDDAARAEAAEKARVIRAEQEELAALRIKWNPKIADRERLRVLEERAKERARQAKEEAAALKRKEQEEATAEATNSSETAVKETMLTEGPDPDAAQKAADEEIRIIREEGEEIAQLRTKYKLKRSEKERLQELEARAEARTREAEEAAAKAAAEAAQAAADAAKAAADAAQAEADEKARIIQEEEEEIAQLSAKYKLRRSEKERLQELQERAEVRTREAEEAAAAVAAAEAGAAAEAAKAEAEEKARVIREEENEIGKLRARYKLNRDEKERLQELEERAKSRLAERKARLEARRAEQAAAAAAQAAAEAAEAAQAEADQQARIIKEEEDELAQLRSRYTLKRADRERLHELEDRAKSRSEARKAKEAEEVAAQAAEAAQAEAEAAQAEADKQASIIQEEEDEIAKLRAKYTLRRADRERLHELEERSKSRSEARKAAEEAAAAAQAAEAAQAEAEAAQAEADEQARIIQEEEDEIARLRAKYTLRRADRERLQELEERAKLRSRVRKVDEATPHGGEDDRSGSADEAPVSDVDDAGDDDQAERDAVARLIEADEMELELLLSKPKLRRTEKVRLKELQESKESREREAAAKAKASAAPQSSNLAEDHEVNASSPYASATENADLEEPDELDDLAREIIEEEEQELELLLSKSKLKRAEKIRLQFLQENKTQREEEAASKAEAKNSSRSNGDVDPPAEDTRSLERDDLPAEKNVGVVAAAQNVFEDAFIAAEEQELKDLLARYRLKSSEKTRLKELQERKNKRDEEARIAAEKAEEVERLARERAEQEAKEEEERRQQAEQEAREAEDRRKQEKEERRRVKIAAEEAEIASLKSRRKLRSADRARLAELEARAQERASVQAQKLAEEKLKKDAANADTGDLKPSNDLSWADGELHKDHNAGDDWMDWGNKSKKESKDEPPPNPSAVGSESEEEADENLFWSPWGTSKKEKKKGKSRESLDFSGAGDLPAVPDAPPAVPDAPPAFEADAFDFGWAQSSKRDGQPVAEGKNKIKEDAFWSTFGSSKHDRKTSKEALDGEQLTLAPTPSKSDLTETGTGHGTGSPWDDPISSTAHSTTKSRSSDKDRKKSPKPDPKLSRKELERLEKDKRKAEKEQRERDKREAEEAAERARIEEEDRVAAEARAEEERLAFEAEEKARKEEEEKQAALAAIAQEEADLAALQAKKDSGKKLTWRETDKFSKLSASCQARADEKAAEEAAQQAKREEEENLAREAQEQAERAAIEKEEADLKDLQRRKESGRKLLHKEKEKYKMLLANKEARDEAAREAEALKNKPAPTDDTKTDDDFEGDPAESDASEVDEPDEYLSSTEKPAEKPVEAAPLGFWGAIFPGSKKEKSPVAEPVSASRSPHTIPTDPISATPAEDVAVGLSPTSPTCPSQSVPAEIAHAEPPKPLEATISSGSAAVEDGTTKDIVDHTLSARKATEPLPSQPEPQTGSKPNHDLDIGDSNLPACPPLSTNMKARKPLGGKIADRLKAFEATTPQTSPGLAPAPSSAAIPIPRPPLPPRPTEPETRPSKDKEDESESKAADVPGSFPAEGDERVPDDSDIVGIIDMAPHRSSKDKKPSKSKMENIFPLPPPPPPILDDNAIAGFFEMANQKSKKDKKSSKTKTNGAVPVPPPPPPPPAPPRLDDNAIAGFFDMATQKSKKDKKSSKSKNDGAIPVPPPVPNAPDKEQTAANAGSGWGIWTPFTGGKEEPSSSQSKHADELKRENTSRSPEKGRPSAPRLSSDKAERVERGKEKVKEAPPRPKLMSVFSSTPPISRSTSMREKHQRENRSYRRPSDVTSGMVSPPYEQDVGIFSSKAAKILGVGDGLGRSRSKRKDSSQPVDKDDIAMFGANGAAEPGPETTSRRRAKQYPRDDDIPMKPNGKPLVAHARPRRKQQEGRQKIRAQPRTKLVMTSAADAKRKQRNSARLSVKLDVPSVVLPRPVRRMSAGRLKTKKQRGKNANGPNAMGGTENVKRALLMATRQLKMKPVGLRVVNGTRPAREKASVITSVVIPKMMRSGGDGVLRGMQLVRLRGRHKSSKTKAEPTSSAWPHFGTSTWVRDHIGAGPPPDPKEVVVDVNDAGAAARREGHRRRKYGDGVVDVEVAEGDPERRRRKRREDRGDGSDDRKKHVTMDDAAQKNGGGGSWWKKLAGY